jgi:hypothetical protein
MESILTFELSYFEVKAGKKLMIIHYVIRSQSASLANQFQTASSITRNINSHMNLVVSTNRKYRFGYQLLTAGIEVERPQFT